MRERGFTLIELLAVLAIIGVLSAIAIPQFSQYRERAWDANVKSMARTLYNAEEAYYSDNEDYYNCTIDNGVSTCTNLPGAASLNFTVFSALLKATPNGVLVAVCHVRAPHGFNFITDSAHRFYSGGSLDQFNIGGAGSCSMASFAGA